MVVNQQSAQFNPLGEFMSDFLLPGLFDLVGKVVDRVWEDPAKKAEAQMAVLKMQQDGEFKQLDADLRLALAQSDVNKAEAAAPDLFTRGWRPFIGWVCGLALFYQLLFRPIANGIFGPIFPSLETDTLMTLLFGMLGLGAYRTTEKIKGVA